LINYTVVGAFLALFAVFTFLGFYGSRWRRGDMGQLHEWALAGRRLGATLAFFLVGADLYTAYTFVAVPSGVFAAGALYAFAIPYVAITFGVALAFAPKLWKISREKGYITGSDFVKDRFDSRTLSILLAIVGIVALLPYIALQIVGMQTVLASMLVGTANNTLVEEIALVLAFIVLAAFTFTSGLRGATLTAVFKDILIWLTVITVIGAALYEIGGFGHVFTPSLSAKYFALSSPQLPAYMSLVLGSALALYLYPHAVNGILSAESAHKLRLSTSFLSLYGVGLGVLALFGVLVYAVPGALAMVKSFGSGLYVVPALILNTLPPWLAGVALLGVFVGGLVPAAIMAIAQANLLTRNIVKEFRPNMTPQGETRLAKWASAAFKFIALGFVFVINSTYAIQLQLLGGILILQLFPSLFIGLYTRWFKKEALILGLLGGIFSGVYLVLLANHFGKLVTSAYPTAIGSIYIAIISLGINLLITIVLSAVIPRKAKPEEVTATPAKVSASQ